MGEQINTPWQSLQKRNLGKKLIFGALRAFNAQLQREEEEREKTVSAQSVVVSLAFSHLVYKYINRQQFSTTPNCL